MKLIICLLLLLSSACFANSASSVLRLATHIEPPYIYIQGDSFAGAHIGIVKLLAEKLELDYQVILCPFARCMKMLERGRADIVIGIRKSEQRATFLHFLSEPFRTQHFPLKFYQLANDPDPITQYSDLYQRKLGVLRGALYFEQFDLDANLVKVEAANHEQLLNLLLKRRIDTFPEREESIKPWLESREYQEKIKLAPFEHDRSVDSYIAVSKNSPLATRLDEINLAQSQLVASGVIAELINKATNKLND